MFVKLLLLIILVSLLFTNIEEFENNNKVYITCNNDYIVNDITSDDNESIKNIDLLNNNLCESIKHNSVNYFTNEKILTCHELNGFSGHCNPSNQTNYLYEENLNNFTENPFHSYHDYNNNYKVLFDNDIVNNILDEKGIEIRDNINSSGVFTNNMGNFFSINI